jgi:general secretion pathway protein C
MPLRLDNLQQSFGETGIRRLALACNLMLLGWIGWLIAEPVLDWLERDTDKQIVAPPEKQPARTVEPRNKEQYEIASWHLFGVPAAQSAKVSPAKTNAPETRLNLELNGVYLDDQPEYSRAIISEKGKQQAHYKTGDKLPGNAVLDEIHAGHVLLLSNDRYERLPLIEDRTSASSGSNTTSRSAPRQVSGKPRKPQTRPPSEHQPISKLLSLHPVMSDDAFKGMTIRGISSKGRSLLGTANVKLKQNDVVTAVNGIEILSAEAGKTLLDNYTTAERLELIIKRGRERIPVIIDPDAAE